MRDLSTLGKYCVATGVDGAAFSVPYSKHPKNLRVIASAGEGWEHVSVSLPNRVPNWAEMEFIKRMFFEDDETAFQLHVPPDDHINRNPNVLHMWRPLEAVIPMPPKWMV